MKSEMARVVQEEALGTPLEDALAEVARRMDNTDLDQLGLVARLQRDTGVSAAEVIDRVTETVRERFELRRLVSTLTSQARMSRWIVTLLPVGLLLVISLLNPHYLHPLFSRLSGRASARRRCPARHGWVPGDQEDRRHQGLGRTRTCSSSSLVSPCSALGLVIIGRAVVAPRLRAAHSVAGHRAVRLLGDPADRRRREPLDHQRPRLDRRQRSSAAASGLCARPTCASTSCRRVCTASRRACCSATRCSQASACPRSGCRSRSTAG